jgi:hypothetical protein
MPQSLADKMMVIRGLDIPTPIGHSTASPLGNYERRDQGADTADLYVPTIDQVLAAWSGFYGGADPYMMKSMHVGQGLSWIERSSGVQAMDPATSPQVLFQTLLSTTRSRRPRSRRPRSRRPRSRRPRSRRPRSRRPRSRRPPRRNNPARVARTCSIVSSSTSIVLPKALLETRVA